MAVFDILTFEVKPGRLGEFTEEMGRLKEILKRTDVGLTSVRVAHLMAGGVGPGRAVVMIENTDLGAWGQSLENEIADPEEQQLSERLAGPDAPATLIDRMVLREMSL